LAESEEKLIDSLPKLDTILTYQLAGYTNGNKSGQTDVKDEFEKFDRKFKKKFLGSNYLELKNGNAIGGAVTNYFIYPEGLAPLAIAWQKINSTDQHVFVITFRFKVLENTAILPVPANSP
ncbi:MAG TPA: hypothetical protein VET23_06780, partial [Chitinophagaceae bacterium]|nr:hypothetical protein [Chitinophagaceae bacterium]